MIEVKNIQLRYDQKVVLNSVNKSFELNKIHGIVGLNGAGKTSFFNVLAQIIRTELGEIHYKNVPLSHKSISYLDTQPFFYSRITGREYLTIFPDKNPELNQEELINLLKFPIDNYIATYSTGEQKKLALLGILKQNRPIIILDEPFNGLDLESAKVLETIILRLKEKNKTIFISSHILNPLFNLCDTIHHLADGNFKRSYLPDEFNELDKHIFGALTANAEAIVQQFL
jgi:ABC-2 type transport system ATP-binding protein